MNILKTTFLLLSFTFFMNTTFAQTWETPAIQGYGKVKYFKNAALQPDITKEYKILFHVTSSLETEGVNNQLWHIARQINVLSIAGVPNKNIKIAAVISGGATSIALNNEEYKRLNNKDNPNLDLEKKLNDFGVKLYVCGQAIASLGVNENNINEYNIFTLSGLSDIPILQQQGYILMQ